MTLRRQWRIRTGMALVAGIALLFPGKEILVNFWRSLYIRRVVVTGSQAVLNPSIFKNGVAEVDMRTPGAKRQLQVLVEGLERSGVLHRVE